MIQPGYEWQVEALAHAADSERTARLDNPDLGQTGDTSYLRGMRDAFQLINGQLDPHGPDASELLRTVYRSYMDSIDPDDTRDDAPEPASYPLGMELPGSFYHPLRDRDVIGEVLPTAAGNTSLRIGHTLPERGWQQNAYVTLTPAERARLVNDLLTHQDDAADAR